MYRKTLTNVTLAALAFAAVCFGQGSVFSLDGGSQIQTVNLHHGESYFNFTNSGFLTTAPGNGNICVNVYTFDNATPTMDMCCSVLVKPNQTFNLDINKELRRLTVIPDSVTAVMIATAPVAGACNAATITQAQAIPFGSVVTKRTDFSTTASAGPGPGPWAEAAFTPFILGPISVSQLTTPCAGVVTTCSTALAGAQ